MHRLLFVVFIALNKQKCSDWFFFFLKSNNLAENGFKMFVLSQKGDVDSS